MGYRGMFVLLMVSGYDLLNVRKISRTAITKSFLWMVKDVGVRYLIE